MSQEIKNKIDTEINPYTSVKPKVIGDVMVMICDEIGMVNILTSSSSLNMDKTGYYTFEGTTSTWTLPLFLASVGRRYLIMNQGSGMVTVNNSEIDDNIFAAGSYTDTIDVNVGEIAVLYNNGKSWFKQL